MLYLLTQHSQWNRRHHPYLLCTCHRGDGVKDESHKCMWLSNEEQINLFDRSNRRWAKKREQVGDTNYTQSMHRDWIDENNKGVSHFGVDPYSLPRHNLRFDIFHMKCSITKKLMTYLRLFILNQSIDIVLNFAKVLSTFWNNFLMFIWQNNKAFTLFQGREVSLFIENIPKIVAFLQENIVV